MRKLILLASIHLLISLQTKAYPQFLSDKGKRPKIAVVLSGGGAKGAAHVGALKVIEEAGVPIDMVVGSSMGAIIGGLYSVGHTPECLDSILRAQDWSTLLTDRKKEQELSFMARERDEKYIINIPFNRTSKQDSLQTINSKAGIIEGRNIVKMFKKLIAPEYSGNIDFSKLPTRFACVAVDATSGKEIVFNSGRLDTALRASMSIPGAFQPIRKGPMLLIDGGILNNYPVDVARQMGADIVIGVDVGEGLYNADRIKNMMDIVNQITSICETEKRQKNIKNTDIYIKVDTKGYSLASFTNEAIDSLINRGEQASLSCYAKLKDLADKVGGNTTYLSNRGNHYESPDSTHHNTNDYVFEQFPPDAIGFSANFNQEEMASLVMQAYKTLPFCKIPTQAGVTIRLGKRYKFKASASSMLRKGLYIDFSYEAGYNDIRFNQNRKSLANVTFSDHIVSANITKGWRWATIDGGVRFNNYNFKSTLVDNEHATYAFITGMVKGSKNFWDLNLSGNVNTTNRKRFATSGIKLSIEANAYKGHEIEAQGGNSVYAIRAFATAYISPGNRLTFIPSLFLRSLSKSSLTYGIGNIVGGEWEGHYLSHHIPFFGLSHIEWKDKTVAVARMQARYKIGKHHYITGTFNIGNDGDGFKILKDTTPMVGYGINYSYDSFVGPLGLTLSGSNMSSKPNLFISLGYVF